MVNVTTTLKILASFGVIKCKLYVGNSSLKRALGPWCAGLFLPHTELSAKSRFSDNKTHNEFISIGKMLNGQTTSKASVSDYLNVHVFAVV